MSRSTFPAAISILLLIAVVASGAGPEDRKGITLLEGPDRDPLAEFVALGASSVSETLYVYGGPGSLEGKFQDETGTIPDSQGWTSVDLTAREQSPWHIDTYECADLGSGGPPNHAWWCGDQFESCGEDDPQGGYGNNWLACLEWSDAVSEPAATTEVLISARLNVDTEAGWDFLYLEYETPAGWQPVVDFDGHMQAYNMAESFTLNPEDYVGVGGDEVHLRWRFVSDYWASDEDCTLQTSGAAQIDEIRVEFGAGNTVSFEDCEGATDWAPVLSTAVGDFAKVWPLLGDIDPENENTSPQFAFIDDGVVVPGTGGYDCTTWCYGPGGHIVNPEGGLAGPERKLVNFIRSPLIEIPSGQLDEAVFAFDAYRHQETVPEASGVFYSWQIRSTADAIGDAGWTPWRWVNTYFGSPAYVRHEELVGSLLVPEARFVQLALGAVEMGYYWGIEGTDGTPGPYFDNVSLRAFVDTTALADFTATPVHTHADEPVQFTDLSVGDPVAWAWDFDHDGQTDSTEQSPAHVYGAPGIYSVGLTVDYSGETDSRVRTDYIDIWDNGDPRDDAADAQYSHSASSTADEGEFDPAWTSDNDLGRKWISQGPNTGENFPHWVQIDFDQAPRTVTYLALLAHADETGCMLKDFVFEGSLDGENYTRLHEGGLVYADSPTWQFFEFDNATAYRFYRLMGYDSWATGAGAGRIGIDEWEMGNSGVQAAFTASPVAGRPPLEVQFLDLSTGDPEAWAWDFENDGVVDDQLQNPSNVYGQAGTYSVVLTASAGTDSSSLSKVDYIHILEAAFSASPTFGDMPLTVSFVDESLGAPDSWAWDFDGDGAIDDTSSSPTHEYAVPGEYDVTLIVGYAGAADTLTVPGMISVDVGSLQYLVKPDGTGDYPTIQAAIDSAYSGTTIVLADGVFTGVGNVSAAVRDKWLIIRSESGDPSACVIDAEQTGHCLRFLTEGDSLSVLENVGLVNGLHRYGGGVQIRLSRPTIRGCVFRDNHATDSFGGGASVEAGAHPVFEDCAFIGNTADHYGGGVGIESGSQASFDGCLFYGNAAENAGGAVNVGYGSGVELVGCTFHGNSDGIEMNYGPLVLANSILSGSTAGEAVGGQVSEAEVACCDFFGNAGGPGLASSWIGSDGNFSADPQFCDPAAEDFEVHQDSPCATSACGLVGAFAAGCFTADFSAAPLVGEAPLTVLFSDLTGGEADGWDWDFQNDGIVDDTVMNPEFTYDTPGTYSVSLKVYSDGDLIAHTVKPDLIHALGANSMIIQPAQITGAEPAAVPVEFAGSDSLGAVSLFFDYDDSRLEYQGVQSNVPGEVFTAGIVEGRISVQWFDETGGLDPIAPGADPDTLFALLFTNLVESGVGHVSFADPLCILGDPVGDPLADVSWVDDSPFGDVDISIGAVVSGRVGYYWLDAPVPGAELSMGSPNPDVVTDAMGLFAFERYPYGYYILEIAKDDDLGGINSLDAMKIVRHGSGLEPFNDPDKELAAEVNGSPGINALDALKVVRASVGLDALPSGDWAFVPPSAAFSPLEIDVEQDFRAVRMGDVNGDWLPESGPAGSPPRPDGDFVPWAGESSVVVEIIDAQMDPAGGTASVPVLTAGFDDIGAVSLRIGFADSVVHYSAVQSSVAGVTFFANCVGSEIRIEWYDGTGGSNPISIGSDTLLTIAFDPVGDEGDSTPLAFLPACMLGNVSGDPLGDVGFVDGSIVLAPVSAVGDPGLPSAAARLLPCRPNPFNPSTLIRFDLPEPASVRIDVFDVFGHLVRTLVAGEHYEAGAHEIAWHGRDSSGSTVASGAYFCRMRAGTFVQTQRMMLVK